MSRIKTARINVTVPAKAHAFVASEAARLGTSPPDIVRAWIMERLDASVSKRPPVRRRTQLDIKARHEKLRLLNEYVGIDQMRLPADLLYPSSAEAAKRRMTWAEHVNYIYKLIDELRAYPDQDHQLGGGWAGDTPRETIPLLYRELEYNVGRRRTEYEEAGEKIPDPNMPYQYEFDIVATGGMPGAEMGDIAATGVS